MKIKSNKTVEKLPILLGIESSGLTCSIGISSGDKLLIQYTANIPNIHSRQLAPFIEAALAVTQLKLSDLDGLVLSAGPGSFTGMRIGYSLAKGYAYALGIPIVEVPTLDVWAFQAGPQDLQVMPIIDARRGEIFRAIYHWESSELVKNAPDKLIEPAMFKDQLSEPVLLTGADASKLFSIINPYLPAKSRLLSPASQSPEMWALLALGYLAFKEKYFSDLGNCEPLYLRDFKGVS